MSEEEFKEIAEKTMAEQIMKNLDSALIFTYIRNLEKELDLKDKIINKMAEQLTTPVHSKEWVIKYFEDEIKVNLVEKVDEENE